MHVAMLWDLMRLQVPNTFNTDNYISYLFVVYYLLRRKFVPFITSKIDILKQFLRSGS